MSSQTLVRVFSSANVSKYPTIGKFLAPSPVTSVPQPAPISQDDATDDANLDVLDQLVGQTLLNRASTSPPTDLNQVSGRAKELQTQLATPTEPAEAPEFGEVAEVGEIAATVELAETAPAIETAENAETASSVEMAELSKELQEVSKETKEQREQAEIAEKQQEISNLVANAKTPVAVSDKPVVVLPITAQSKEEAKFKTTKYSVKWLWEWCKKISKVFSGAVVYKEELAD